MLGIPALAAPLTWDRLIKSVNDDPRYQAAEKRTELTSGAQGTKLWEKLELRYQLDGFSFAKHDIELRMTPKRFGEGSADKARYEAQNKYHKSRLDKDRSSLLYDRYYRAVHYIQKKRIAELNKLLAQVNADRIEVLHLKAGSQNFDPEVLMRALEKDLDLKADLYSDSTSLLDDVSKLKVFVADFDSVSLDTTFLPTMEEIAKNIENGVQVQDSYPAIAVAKNKRDSEKARARQDATKETDYIGHVGIGYSLVLESLSKKYKDLDATDVANGKEYYDDYAEEYWKKYPDGDGVLRKLVADSDNRRTLDKFFMNVAIRLPFLDNNRDSELKTQVADLDAESDYMDVVRDVNLKVSRIAEEITALMGQWKIQKEFVEKVNAGSIFEQFANDAGSDPLLLLRARESSLESDMKAIKLETEIYDLYLALLEYSGVLAREGVVNHLAEGLK